MDDLPQAGSLMQVRAMSTGDILRETFSLYSENVGLFVATTAVVVVPYAVIVVLLAAALVGCAQAIIDRLVTTLVAMGHVVPDPVGPAVSLYDGFMAVCLTLAIILYFLIAEPVASAALTIAIAQRDEDRPASVGLVYRSIRPRIGPLVLTTLWAALRLVPLIGACIVLVGIPLVCYCLTAWFFIMPIMMLEDNPGPASKRSRDLVRGEWWRTFAFVCTTLFLSGGATSAVVALAGLLMYLQPVATDPQMQATILVIVAVFVRAIVLPVQVGATTLSFWGMKERHADVAFTLPRR